MINANTYHRGLDSLKCIPELYLSHDSHHIAILHFIPDRLLILMAKSYQMVMSHCHVALSRDIVMGPYGIPMYTT